MVYCCCSPFLKAGDNRRFEMAAKKTKGAAAKGVTTKAPKATVNARAISISDRAAAVEKNLGKSQSLREFLTAWGWR